jgi:hypothetical protein
MPVISAHGFKSVGLTDEQFADGVRKLTTESYIEQIKWARIYLATIAYKRFSYTSYGLKHMAERFHRANFEREGCPSRNPYVCNGALIVAAIELGFDVRTMKDVQGRLHINAKIIGPARSR